MRGFFDFLVAVEELAAHAIGEAPADGGLAGAHHAHKGQGPAIQQLDKKLGLGLPGGRSGSGQKGLPM